MISTCIDTRLEPDLEDLLWNLTNVLHRAGKRIERELNDHEDAQKRSQTEKDNSEGKPDELETDLREGATMIERTDASELFNTEESRVGQERDSNCNSAIQQEN